MRSIFSLIIDGEHSILFSSLIVLALIICLGALGYHYIVYPVYHGPFSHIPGPWLSKITGRHLVWHELFLRRNDQIFTWHQQYGPIVCIGPNEVSTATLQDTHKIYSSTSRWEKSSYFDYFMGYHDRSIFATKPYEAHRERRKVTSGFYQASSIYKRPEIEGQVRALTCAVQQQVSRRYDPVKKAAEIDIYCLADWFALDVITHLALGPRNCTQTVDSDCMERRILLDLKYLQLWGPFRLRFPLLFDCFSRLLTALSPRYNYLHAEDRFSNWCLTRFDAAMRDPEVYASHSLLRRLLENRSDQRLGYTYMAAEVLDNINAAHATVAVTVTYLVWCLTSNPEWQDKVRHELRQLRPLEDGLPSFADIDSVPVLEACLREVYRLHPASSGRAERIVPDGGCVLAGHYVPAKAVATTSVVSLHRDPKIFPEAERFLPTRWLEGTKDELKTRDAHIIPFGYGGRICLGKSLATMEIKLLAAGIYLQYETQLSARSTAESMKQASTHDAVPELLQCIVKFRKVK
ncbi:cytochrome P450 [Aspergillus californicus]